MAKISGDNNGSELDVSIEGDEETIGGLGGGVIDGFGGGEEGTSSHDLETGVAGFNLL